MVPGPLASAPPGNLLEIQILRPYPRLIEAKTLGAQPSEFKEHPSLQGILILAQVWELLPWQVQADLVVWKAEKEELEFIEKVIPVNLETWIKKTN